MAANKSELATRFEQGGHGQCVCKGASSYPQACSVGKIGQWGYLIPGRAGVWCYACTTKWMREKNK